MAEVYSWEFSLGELNGDSKWVEPVPTGVLDFVWDFVWDLSVDFNEPAHNEAGSWMARICIKLMNVIEIKPANQTPKYPQGNQNVFVSPPMTIAMSHTITPPALA